MLNVKRLVLVVIAVMLVSFVFGSINSYATNVRTITANTSSNNNTNSNAEDNTNTNADNNTNTEADRNSTNTNSDNNTNTNSSRNISSSANTNNSSDYSNKNTSTNSSSLPYTGTKSSIVFVGIAFVVSAFYAYKKVSEYRNV